MLTRKSALRSTLAIFLCLSVIFLMGGPAHSQEQVTVTIDNGLVISGQGIVAGSGPIEIFGLNLLDTAQAGYDLTQVVIRVENVGEFIIDGLLEISPSDFLTFEIWADTPGKEPFTRNGTFDPPHNFSFASDMLVGRIDAPFGFLNPLQGLTSFEITIPINPSVPVPFTEDPVDTTDGNDFFVVLRTSQTMDSDPDSLDGTRRTDDFGITMLENSITVIDGIGVLLIPVEDPDVTTESISCESLALDMRPIAMDKSNPRTFDLRHPGTDFDEPNGSDRYLYHIMGQSIRPRYLGERDRDFSGTDTRTFEAFEVGLFEQPVVETLERRQAVIGLDVAGGSQDNPEHIRSIALTFTNFPGPGDSFLEFNPHEDLDFLRGDDRFDPRAPFFSGIAVYRDTNNNGVYDEPTLDPETFGFDPLEADIDLPLDFTVGVPPPSSDMEGFYEINDSRTHYLLRLNFDVSLAETEIDAVADELPDYFVVIRPDSGDEDDGPIRGDGGAINFGADFKISLEREETPGDDLNADGLVQPSPVVFLGGDAGSAMAISAVEDAFDGVREVRELHAVAKVQDLHYDWGFDVAENFPLAIKIPHTIDATSPPIALLALNIAVSDVPQLKVVDRPKFLSEIRLNFSGNGFDPDDIEEIMLIRDDKSPSSGGDISFRQIGVFDMFDDLLNLPFPGGSALDPTNPDEDSPIRLKDFEWVQDGPESWHVVIRPILMPRLYPDDNLEEDESIDNYEDNFEMIQSGFGSPVQIPRDIVFSGADFFIAIRTSDTIAYGDEISLNIPRLGLSFTTGRTRLDTTAGVFNPEMPPWLLGARGGAERRSIRANVPVELTSLVKPGQGILASSLHTPVIGINMYTNQPEGGVDVFFEQLMVVFLQFGIRDSFNLKGGDLLPFVFEDITEEDMVGSGIQIWRDAPGSGNGSFDPTNDILVHFDDTPRLGPNPSIGSTVGDENDQVLMIFSSPENRQEVPRTDEGDDLGDDFFVVIRTSSDFDHVDDNFSVAIISWGPDSIFAPPPNLVDSLAKPPFIALNRHQAFPSTRRGIGFVDSIGIRSRSNETINTAVLNSTFATMLEPVDDLEAEFTVGDFSSHEVTVSWRDTNGNEDDEGEINEPQEDGYILEFELFGVWMPFDTSPITDATKDINDIITVKLTVPTSFSGDTVKFRIFPFNESFSDNPALGPPFNGPGPKVEFFVTFGTSSLPTTEGGGGGGGCFIATAAYGTDSADDVMALRRFRDERLLETATGRALVKLYYKLSPPLAAFIAERPLLRKITRTGIAPAVAFASVSLAATPAERAFIWAVFAVLALSGCVMFGRRLKRLAQRIRNE